jgi:2,4-dienoyl-CoA reductase-like NADH-dependent reductase (Old Yellow Enzyme family)
MSVLFSPQTLRGLTVPNRIVVAPMCQYSAEEGLATSWHSVHLGTLALSGAGMVTIEATAVTPDGRITPRDLGLWDDTTEAALARTLGAVRDISKTVIVMQIGHAGRKASSHVPWEGGQLIPPGEGGWNTVAPSALPQKEGEAAPVALDETGLARIRDAFAATALRAARLGIDGIEVHAAHGYLLHQFLSPIANQRQDAYGGALENRMRFPLEVFEAVRAAFPADRPVGIRISASDWLPEGWDVEQSIRFVTALKQRGADWVSVSSGGISPLQKIKLGPNYQVPFAQAVKAATNVPTMTAGLITEARQAEEIIAAGQADFVAIARGMLFDPRWGWHAAATLGASVEAPPQYWRATPHEHKELFRNAVFGTR